MSDGTLSGHPRAAEITACRPDMLRFARLQLRDLQLAEDAVQEALISALTGIDRFSGQSSLKTWVFSILRFKIVDLIRARARETSLEAAFGETGEPDPLDEDLFDARGHWQAASRPLAWNDPEAAYEQDAFWRVFEACLDHLPEQIARVFMMREVLGLETAEICKDLGLTATNCWVILHRARQRLRVCLSQRWFDGAGAAT